MDRDDGSSNGNQLSSTLSFLSSLAFDGLQKPLTGEHPRLVFDESNIKALKPSCGEKCFNACD